MAPHGELTKRMSPWDFTAMGDNYLKQVIWARAKNDELRARG